MTVDTKPRVRPYSDTPCWHIETDYEVAHYDTAEAAIADNRHEDEPDPTPLQESKPCWIRQCAVPGCSNLDDGDGTFSIVHYLDADKPDDDYECPTHA